MRGAVKKSSSLLLPKHYCFVVGVISRKYQPENFFMKLRLLDLHGQPIHVLWEFIAIFFSYDSAFYRQMKFDCECPNMKPIVAHPKIHL